MEPLFELGMSETQNHPSIKATFKELQTKLGVVYYYKMTKQGLHVYLVDIDGKKRE